MIYSNKPKNITWDKIENVPSKVNQFEISGNAETATKLETARTINGVAFDGSSDIIISGLGDSTISGISDSIGSIKVCLSKTAPAGYLALDTGALVSRTTYPDLWTWVQANAPLISDADWQTQASTQSSVGSYSTGDGSTTFRLPKLLDYSCGGSQAEVGNWIAAGLPNITGTLSVTSAKTSGSGAFSGAGSTTGYNGDCNGASAYSYQAFSAAKSNSIYGKSNTVQPASIKMLYCVKAFDAETNQGLIDITSLANDVVNKTDYIADFTKSFGATGYQKLPSGLILQWGVTAISTSTIMTQTFPIAFPTQNFGIKGAVTGAGNSNIACPQIHSQTTSQFTWSVNNSSNAYVSGITVAWFAIGY